jgi:EAL domain-containing protein (putative c-di-GMP-specific phosphodiesterase class I)/DNA-binding NarL/FixJ family response regulator
MPQTESASEGGLNLAFVLDDEPKVQAHICNILRREGIDARGFVKAERFLSAIGQCNPDLVILDLALGNTDAVEVIRRLEILKFMGRVLLVSGCDDTTLSEIEQIGQNRSLFMLRSLRKPFGIDEIKERLATSAALGDAVLSHEIEPADLERSGARPHREQVSLIEALRKNWLEVWYQPKVDLKSRMVCGAEALIRARHPDHGLIEPKELLPPVGDPLYKPLSLFVLRRTMQAWAAFADKGRLLKLSVNVPASILTTPGFVDIVRLTIPRVPTFPGVLIEVTEEEIIRDVRGAREVATQLKLYNALLSLDDFGTAYASLSRLTALPFAELKLDRCFVSGCASDKVKYAVCQTAVDVARRFGASLCAEGIETADDLQCVTELGFDSAQGYFFAKPMPPDRFLMSLSSAKWKVSSERRVGRNH